MPDVDGDELVEAVEDALHDCSAVAGLSAGQFGTARSYLPGRTVQGIDVSADELVVRVVLAAGATVAQLTEQVLGAVSPLAGRRALTVHVDDVQARVDDESRDGSG